MISSDLTSPATRWLSISRFVRLTAGVLVIETTIVTVGSAVWAQIRNEDTSQAMKIPFTFAVVLLIVFTQCVLRIQRIEASLRK